MKTNSNFFTIFQFLIISISINCSKFSEDRVKAYSGLILRKTPSSHSEKILLLPNNEKIKILDINGPLELIENNYLNWIKIEYNGNIGWVFGGYLENIMKDNLNKCAHSSGIYFTVSESEWDETLTLDKNCNYYFLEESHYDDNNGKIIENIKTSKGKYFRIGDELFFKNSADDKMKFKYSKSISFKEFGSHGEAPGLIRLDKKVTSSFFRFEDKQDN